MNTVHFFSSVFSLQTNEKCVNNVVIPVVVVVFLFLMCQLGILWIGLIGFGIAYCRDLI